jgi:acyl-CoA reductase-like NAD-dependent aldehyde dehydrogenase
MEKYQQFIDGKFVDSESGETRASINPATEEPIATVPVATRGDARRAVTAARRAFESRAWSGMDVKERARLLMKVVDRLRDRQDELARIESADAGATIRKTSMMDIPIGIEHFKALVELGERVPAYEPLPWIDMPAVSWNFVQREPIGVCAGIIPWNLPFMMAAWKIAPALVMGNTLVLKPATETPLTALEIARTAAEAGLPDGVLNVVTGSGAEVGEELCVNPDVDKVSLTGSTDTGRRVMKLAADTVKKVTLELGGKSPTLICDDADLSVAVDAALFGTFFHAGQLCESGTRCLVPERLHDEFMERLLDRVGHVTVGDTADYETTMGPVVSAAQHARVLGYIEAGVRGGARLACGGARPSHLPKGWFVQPTVFDRVDNASVIAREEIFGPVLSVITYRDLNEAVALANDSPYGLGGAVFSRDIPKAISIAKRIRTGTVWVNDYHLLNALAPFGGYKQSGTGRELGPHGLLEFTQVKHIHVDLALPRSQKFWYDYVLND